MQTDLILENFYSTLLVLAKNRIIIKKDIISYSSTAKHNLHSLLQYCLVIGAHRSGLMGIPEFKVRLSKPLSPCDCDGRFKKGRLKHQFRVDVAFFKQSKYIGFGEVYTLDELHGCLRSIELKHAWVSPYHKLLHLAEHSNSNFCPKIAILVNVIPKELKPYWHEAKDSRIDYLNRWKKLATKLRSIIPKTAQITIQEDKILIDEVSRAIKF